MASPSTPAGAADRYLIKICGVTRLEDARRAIALGADLIGLNFHPPSPRALDLERAREIAGAVSGRALVAGVFVDLPVAEIERLAEAVPLDLIQLHGRETPAGVSRWGRRAIKVFKVGESFDPGLIDDHPEAWGFLFDVAHPELHGGTGQGWNYATIAGLKTSRTVLVAGGLKPGAAAAALRASGADGVDVCSGVESAPGVKDAGLMERLIREVRDAEEGE